MSTITRERLQRLIRAINSENYDEEEIVECVNSDEILELARIALASLEAEERADPVAFINGAWTLVYYRPPKELGLKIGDKLYTAPPAKVSVPDERYQHLSELYHAQEKRLFKLAQRIKGSSFDKYAHSTSQAIDVLESAIFGESDHTCRAAMLQGADGNSPVVPDGYALVPVEPTTNQWAAGMQAFDSGMDKVTRVYKAMLAAAPQQEDKNV